MSAHMHPDDIRTLFSSAMSEMYRAEVPQYGTLIDLVREVNTEVLSKNPALARALDSAGELTRLDVERHGAIRVGTAEEMRNMRRIFAVMGMVPVGYYDLSVAGLPVHSTAFRPVEETSLARNPFRVFCSLLRLDLLEDRSLAAKAEAILSRRQIVTDRALELLDLAEAEGGLNDAQAKEFVTEALETFRWHSEATVSAETYEALCRAHRLIADVVCFRGPHINHLTPRTLDIDAVQKKMPEWGIAPKAVVEGPPSRKVAILLRQTSFKALNEVVSFEGEVGTHTARFGEIEQRGVALKLAGRALYDTCLAKTRARAAVGATGEGAGDYMAALVADFAEMPDDIDTLRRDGLAYFKYRAKGGERPAAATVEELIAEGALIADPQTYDDFLPVSAAGIFQSNLGTDEQTNFATSSNREILEAALGVAILDEQSLYAGHEAESLTQALTALGQAHLI